MVLLYIKHCVFFTGNHLKYYVSITATCTYALPTSFNVFLKHKKALKLMLSENNKVATGNSNGQIFWKDNYLASQKKCPMLNIGHTTLVPTAASNVSHLMLRSNQSLLDRNEKVYKTSCSYWTRIKTNRSYWLPKNSPYWT